MVDQLLNIMVNQTKYPQNYEGSPYLIDSFVTGTITLTSGVSFNLPIRYNLFQDIFDVQFQGRLMEIRTVDLIKKIDMPGYNLIPAIYPSGPKEIKGYLFLLDTGKISLLCKRHIAFDEWKPTKALESGPTPAKFREERIDFFARLPGGNLYRLKNLKDLLTVFPDNKSKVEMFIKENKIKLKLDKLKQLFHYYNSL